MSFWTDERKARLVEIVLGSDSRKDGLHQAAKEFSEATGKDISFIAVRNYYYKLMNSTASLQQYLNPRIDRRKPVISKKMKRMFDLNMTEDELPKIAESAINSVDKTEEINQNPVDTPFKEVIQPSVQDDISDINIPLATELKSSSLSDTLMVVSRAIASEIDTYRMQIETLRFKNAELQSIVDREGKDQSVFEEIIAAEEEKNKELIRTNNKLEEELIFWKTKYKTLEEDYSVVSKVINLAKDMAAKEEIGIRPSPNRFKMDQNGNLERLPLVANV